MTALRSQDLLPEEWLELFHGKIGEKPFYERGFNERMELISLRQNLIDEECSEALEALDELRDGWDSAGGSLKHVAKELADVCVVAIGTAQLLGIPFSQVFEEVMISNLSKIPADGKLRLRKDGKLLKPASYKEPDLSMVP